ncbi:MAG: hypothetical protein HC845_12325 [Akkermansiaceae bacterium]|nr:hypothetical protein [Akkermansiaceae bacterium]
MKILITTIFLLGATCGSYAATAAFSATLNGINYSYTNQQSAYAVTNIVTTLAGFDNNSGYIAICFDFDRRSYWAKQNTNSPIVNYNVSETIDTNLTNSAVFNDTPLPQNESLAVAQAGWLVDNFFVNKFVNGNATTRGAFAQVIWEITKDGGTTGVNLDFTANDFIRSTGSFATGTAIRTEMELMKNALAASGVTSSYTWSTVHYLIETTDPLDQDYLILKAPIPEVGSSLLVVLLTVTGLTCRWRPGKAIV